MKYFYIFNFLTAVISFVFGYFVIPHTSSIEKKTRGFIIILDLLACILAVASSSYGFFSALWYVEKYRLLISIFGGICMTSCILEISLNYGIKRRDEEAIWKRNCIKYTTK